MSATDRLDQIEARANAATEGPWHRYGTWPYEVYAPSEPDGGPYVASVTGDDEHNESNAEFIARARTDMPALVAALRAVHTIAFDPDTISALEHGHIEFGPNLFEGVSKDDALSYARDALKDIRDAIEEALS